MKFPQWWGFWQVARDRMRRDSSAFRFLRKVPIQEVLGARAISIISFPALDSASDG